MDWQSFLSEVEDRINKAYGAVKLDDAAGTFFFNWDDQYHDGFTIYFAPTNTYTEYLSGDEYDYHVTLKDLIAPIFLDIPDWVLQLRSELEIFQRLLLGIVELAAISSTESEAFKTVAKTGTFLMLSAEWHDVEYSIFYSNDEEIETSLQLLYLPGSPPTLVDTKRISDKKIILFGEEYALDTRFLRGIGLGFDKVPEEIGLMKVLEEVELQGNCIYTLPEVFYDLRKLKKINLGNNRLEAVSTKIHQLEKLNHLILTNNQLRNLPETLVELAQLEQLDLQGNKLSRLISGMARLRNLEMLNALENELQELPDLPASLQWLNLYSNQLKELPASFANLSKLQKLIISNNAFTSVPEVLFELKALESLELGGNYIEDVPEELKLLPNIQEIRIYPNPFSKEKRAELRSKFGELIFVGYDTDPNSFMI